MIIDALLTLLFIVACGIVGWFVFLLFARLLTAGNPFQKSEDMEADNNTIAAGEQQQRIGYLYSVWDNYGEAEAAELEAMRQKHNAREDAANAARWEQQNTETVRSFGCAALLAPFVCAFVVWGLWFSSKYPSFESVRVLLGW